ncbi:MAG: hypothetical protein GQF41_4414 [Candidatus Rifleibacterium amylolyticum]|nr:MAG: hypothetical protein GQF41_4414 [Candidatus Rifleibacterium amylolyticum]
MLVLSEAVLVIEKIDYDYENEHEYEYELTDDEASLLACPLVAHLRDQTTIGKICAICGYCLLFFKHPLFVSL